MVDRAARFVQILPGFFYLPYHVFEMELSWRESQNSCALAAWREKYLFIVPDLLRNKIISAKDARAA